MPYYKVTITDKQGKTDYYITQEVTKDIDLMYAYTKQTILRERPADQVAEIEVVMLRSGCKEVKQWVAQRKVALS
ncbi:MAG: hypothetical protein V4649_16235 [Bacteroidota bacterium]